MRTLSPSPHVGDVGVNFEFTMLNEDMPVNATGISEVEFTFQRPDRTTFTRTGVVVDESTAVVRYLTTAFDLDAPGTWKVQVRVVMPLWAGRTETMLFTVKDNLLDYVPPEPSGFSSGFSSGFGL